MEDLVARAKMLVHRPAAEVFDAFVQPGTLTRFWLERATGPLHAGAQVEWHFLVPGARETVSVTTFDKPHHLAFTWLDGHLDVDIHVLDAKDGGAVVSIEASGFEHGDDAVAQVVNATEGFTIVLCDLKTLLETGRSANLVKDKAALIQHEHNA